MNPTTTLDTQARLWDLVGGAGPMVKFVLLVLLLLSVFSWAIIIYKVALLRKAERETQDFYDIFWEKRQFPQILTACRDFDLTPLKTMFKAVYSELSSAKRGEGEPSGVDMDCVQRILKKTSSSEVGKLEYAVNFLATTGNTAPFIGLFGTVWGIMNSFRSIGMKGSASLAVVAPGIAEALIATAMGLVAAIPAVVAYNHILSRITRLSGEMDNFSSDLLNIIEKQVKR